jgi:nicotinamidase-related amidase
MDINNRDMVGLETLAAAGVVTASSLPSGASAQTAIPPVRNFAEHLTRDNSCAILVDFLDGFLPGLKTIDHFRFRKNAEAFAELTQIFALPTIFLGEEGSFRGNFFPEVVAKSDHAVRVERHTPSAWGEPVFQTTLAGFNRRKVILGGISLDICTQLLTLDLLANGYEPYVVVDISGSDSMLVETAAMLRMTQAGAVMVSWASIASEILADWQTAEGPTIGALYQNNSVWGNRV